MLLGRYGIATSRARFSAVVFVTFLIMVTVYSVSPRVAPLPASHLATLQVQEVVGIDGCTAGSWTSTETQSIWDSYIPQNSYSPRTIAGYIGGPSMGSCDVISSTWATNISSNVPGGWGVVPIWVGAQAPYPACTSISYSDQINPSNAVNQGVTDGGNAAAAAEAAGFSDVLFDDMEGYNYTASDNSTPCGQIVTSYLNGWVAGMEAAGFSITGVYGSAGSTIQGLAYYAGASGMHEPSYIWAAEWTHESLWNLGYSIPNGDWINDQRDVQYGHNYNTGTPYNLTYDADCIDAGASNGVAESTWDYGSSSDGGGSEGNSVSADTLC